MKEGRAGLEHTQGAGGLQSERGSALAVAFTGQGSQVVGMGRDFYQYPESKAVYEEASDALKINMRELCFSDEAKLNQTEFTQPAILTTEMSIFSVLRHRYGFCPALFSGHSLGEYTALVAAGAITLSDGVVIVRERGALMQRSLGSETARMVAVSGDMLNISGIRDVCLLHSCDIANFNSPHQIVLSGAEKEVDAVVKELMENGGALQITPLTVSAAFHSRYMQPVAESFRILLQSFKDRINLSAASKVLSNASGDFHAPQLLLASLVEQLYQPVYWTANMNRLKADAKSVIEIGPKRILGRFFEAIGLPSASISNERTLRRALGVLHG